MKPAFALGLIFLCIGMTLLVQTIPTMTMQIILGMAPTYYFGYAAAMLGVLASGFVSVGLGIIYWQRRKEK